MSKQSDAKAGQGYSTAIFNCGNCTNMKSERAIPAWMAELNAKDEASGNAPRYTLDRHGEEKSFRCGIGGFAIKKTATCKEYLPKATGESK